ncbi:hypothetical protein [Natrinema sp. 1APR25-10V2]|uniref:DNA replication complex subunit Gins51 n=1 Tax=Natrinema sp. 1APR25-10V2 TaxID=2951081 RepID=UPI002875845B|nr:hypothetical protein [Natrinema sp. 1APR25-10V2]MDS0474928.1 hypothetical protein [Natrinema sp. 1APR25-10V2]
MNLDELRSVQSKERQKDSLQNLRPSFYQEVGEYIADLEDERDRVADRADDPFSSPEVGRLTDEIETAKDVVEAIYERRMGKLVKQASLAAAGMPADDEGLTAEEADLFDDLVDRIGSNKSRVLDVLEGVEASTVDSDDAPDAAADPDPTRAGEPSDPQSASTDPAPDRATADDTPPVPPEEPPTEVDPGTQARSESEAADSSGVSAADVMGGDGPSAQPAGQRNGADTSERAADAAREPDTDHSPNTGSDTAGPTDGSGDAGSDESTESAPAAVDRTTVRITSDIGSILGVDDREYTLTSDDVVTLPEENAAPLVDREAAERLE